MADNFDLKKFLKENKIIENSNRYLKEDARTDAEEEGYLDGMRDEKADLKSKIREIILNELGNPEDSYDPDIDDDYGDSSEEEYFPHMQGLEDAPMEDDFDPRLMEDSYKIGQKKTPGAEDMEMEDGISDMMENEPSEKEEYEDALIDGGFASLEEAEEEAEEEKTEEETKETEELPGEEGGDEEAPAGEGGGFEDIAADMEGTEGELMDHLMSALKVAKGMNNEKLTTQIGNTLKFFVSEYIGGEE